MDTYQIFSNTAQDIHNKHFEQKTYKDQEIAERRILDYFNGKLNLSWRTILREINKLNELSRNKYFEQLISDEITKNNKLHEKTFFTMLQSFDKLKKANWILLITLLFQTCTIIYLKWGLNV